jgi:hypothetical protein
MDLTMMERNGDRKNGRILFDRPKPTAGCSASGREFGIPKKLIRLIKTCLNEACSRVRVGKNLSGMLPIKNGLKQGDV